MTDTDVANATLPNEPTLVELIDLADPSGANTKAVREAAVKLETERALLRAELSERLDELNLTETELASVKEVLEAEEKEADDYARKMHASDDVATFFYERFVASGAPVPFDTPATILEKLGLVLARTRIKGSVKPAHKAAVEKIMTESKPVYSPLVELE